MLAIVGGKCHSARRLELILICGWVCVYLAVASATGRDDRLRFTVRDMVSTQLPGLYTLIPLGRASSSCPQSLRIGQVEITGGGRNEQVFVVPHSHVSVPSTSAIASLPNSSSNSTSRVQCDSVRVSENMLTGRVSGTILRRGSDVELDRRVALLDRLALSGGRFYVGYEHGARRCGGHTVPDSTVSVWAAPGRVVTAVADDLVLRLDPGTKYIYYFSTPPCFYRGDAAERGRVVRLASPTPSPIAVRGGGSRPTARPDAVTAPRGGGGRPECFPRSAVVRILRTGSVEIPIRNLQVGDVVDDGSGGWTRVLASTHTDDSALVRMVRLKAGNESLTLTRGHMIPTNRGLLASEDVRVGDYVYQGVRGLRRIRVVALRMVWARGLYAPVTASGTIQVNGMLVTTYAVRPSAAHAALAPLRLEVRIHTSRFSHSHCDKYIFMPELVALVSRFGRWVL